MVHMIDNPNCTNDFYWSHKDGNLATESVEKGGGPGIGFKRYLNPEEFPITYNKVVSAASEFEISKCQIDECLNKRLSKDQYE